MKRAASVFNIRHGGLHRFRAISQDVEQMVQSQTCTVCKRPPARTHAHTHARTHAHIHICTHMHAHARTCIHMYTMFGRRQRRKRMIHLDRSAIC